jgi:predicted GNAT family N-acyltransferase
VANKTCFGLFVKASCSVCLNGLREGVFTNCPYCDVDRKQIIEASFKIIKETLNENLTTKQRTELIKLLTKKKDET